MNAETHRRLVADTEKLRTLAAKSRTEEAVGWCWTLLQEWGSAIGASFPLTSPVRQVFFFLGLMLTTEEPTEPESLGDKEWERVIELLNSVFGYYTEMYWPSEEAEVTDEWIDARIVAMPAFLHYFNVAILASVEQLRARFEAYVAPFDDVLLEKWGIAGTEVLRIIGWLGSQMQSDADELTAAFEEERAARWELLDRAQQNGWGMDRIREEAQKESYMPLMEKLLGSLDSVGKVRRAFIEGEFGAEKADPFWDLMVSHRGGSTLQYITELNPAESCPLFETEKGVAMCPSYNALYYALLNISERALLADASTQPSFLRHRDKTLEAEAHQELKRLLGEEADYWVGVYETADLHYEHDIVVRWRDKIIVAEAKASPPVEPFRDPDKARSRIERAFRSDRGIQKGFEQADRLRQRLDDGETVELFGTDRRSVVTISPEEISDVYTICVTRDDFGVLAVDLSLLLQKVEGAPYPWAVNIFDLNALANAYEYFGWSGDRFITYLDERRQVQGKLIATDELEVAGFAVEHGSLQFLVEHGADKCHLRPSYSNVFDRIYNARRGGKPVEYEPTQPHATDMRNMLDELRRDAFGPRSSSERTPPRQGRNERCACGSGKKYKYCCGSSSR